MMQQRVLSEVKRRSVNRMDRRNSQLMSGQSSENSGFGAVRMDELRSIFGERSSDGSQRFPVLQRIHAASQFGKNANIQPACDRSLLKRTLGTMRVPSEQANLIAKQMMLIVHVEQRVFLRTTDNHSSNNVGDTHGRKCSEENQ
jgi:hypothetical protein